MKKRYQRPLLICEDLHPETMLCSCEYVNTSMNEEWHCGFDPDGLGFNLFADNWDNCVTSDAIFGNLEFCTHMVEAHVFSAS